MIVSKQQKMADVIMLNYHLLPVINRFGIQLGFGDKTIEEVCLENGVNVDFFLEIINAHHNREYQPKNYLQSFSVILIIDYLKKTHESYRKIKIPEIELLIKELFESCRIQKQNLLLVKKFFDEYKTEFIAHITKENERIYPFALSIEKAYKSHKADNKLLQQIEKYSINDFAAEHDDLEEKLFDLKSIIIKYLPPPKNSNLCNTILFKLFELETDLNNHTNIENKVLVPKVAAMENQLLSM